MTDDKPIQIIRDSQICVSYTVRSALSFIAQAKGIASTDALAEGVIMEWLSANHADVLAHIKTKQDLDKTFRLELKKKLGTPVPFED